MEGRVCVQDLIRTKLVKTLDNVCCENKEVEIEVAHIED